MFARRHVLAGRFEVAQDLVHGRVVLAMKGRELVEDVMPSRDGWVPKDLPAGHDLEGDATEAQADLDAAVARVLALGTPLRRQHLEVVVANDQVVGDSEDRSAERAIAVADQGAVSFIDLVALVARGPEAGTTGDGLGSGVVFDRPGFASEIGGADDIDAGEAQQQHIRRLHQAAGNVAFQSGNFLGFLVAIAVVGQGNAQVLLGSDVTRGRLSGPVQDDLEGALLEADAGATQDLSEVGQGCLLQSGDTGKMVQQAPGYGAVPEFVEAGGKARQAGLEVFADLTVEGGAFADQVAPLADEQLQGGPGLVAAGFLEGAAGDGGAVNGAEVGVIGFVAGINGLAILLGDEGMENAGLETGAGEGALDEAVVASGAFDGDDAIEELVVGEGLSDLSDGGVESQTVVRDVGWWDEHAAVEVGQEKLG